MRTVLVNLVYVIGGEAAVRAANFAAVLFIAREYGAATLGAYAVSLALVTVVVMFVDNGLQTAAITQLSSDGTNRNNIIGRLTLSKTILLSGAAVILTVAAGWIKPGHFFLAIGVWVTVRAILQSYSQLQMAVLKSVSKTNWIGIIQSVHGGFLFAGIYLSFRQGWSIVVLLGWLTLCQLLELLLSMAVLYRGGIWPTWHGRLGFLAIMRIAAPFGIAYGLANLIVRSDTIVLSRFVPLAELGAFSAANSILLIVYVSAWLFGSVLLPEMVRLSGTPESLRLYTNQWARWLALVTVPCALLVSLVAPRLIVALYGAAFAGSGVLGSVMALACPFIILNSVYTTFTIAANTRMTFVGIYGACALATVGLDLCLGRAFGSMGIASAIAIREAGMLAAFRLLTHRVRSSDVKIQPRLLRRRLGATQKTREAS
jgi:O-antigen/teichoic acid export membrane protein